MITSTSDAPVTITSDPASKQRGLLFLTIAVAMAGFTLSLQTGLNSNFVGQTLGLSASQQGWLEGARESCGILAIVVMALLAGLSEPRIGVLMLILVSIGISAYAIVPSFGFLVIASLIWSQGFHVWTSLPNSMAMALAEKGHEGRILGRLGAASAVASAVALVLALVLHRLGVLIRPMWIVAGAAAFIGALACTRIPTDIKAPGARLILRKRYGLFYLLQFLEGWRKQIFIAFAGYMLVTMYSTPIQTMLILFLIANAAGWFTSPLVGRIIDRYGEKRVLLFYYSTMAIVFICYATVKSPWLLYALFVCDSVLFVCTMALTTYVSRVAPPEEHTATLTAGVAANHVASVLMPIFGGMLWSRLGYQWAFYAGTVMAIITLSIVLRMLPAPDSHVKEL